MDLEALQQLVEEGESDRLEFKRSTGELREGMETLCGFLNERGGRVLFGVANNGKILGQQIADTTLQDVARAIQRLEPPVHVTQQRVSIPDHLEVLVLDALPVNGGPYTYDGRPFQRIGTTTQRMPTSEYERRLLTRLHSQHRWENRPAEGYTMDDLDVDEIKHTLETAVAVGRLESVLTSPREALKRLGLQVDSRILQAAVVAFGHRLLPDYPQCSLRLARFRGTTKTEFLDQRQLQGHAFLLLREADLFLRRHLPIAGRIQPGIFEREDQPMFPPLALREALVNALCHRDYTIPGGAVSVGIYDDRLEITSTGTLPPGITIADLKREHTSRPRNPLLAEVFYRRGLIERWGRGTQKIVELCQAAGHPEPEFEEQAGEVVVRFLPSDYIPPHRVSHDLTERQRQILQILSDGKKRPFRDIFQRLACPPSERTAREDLILLRNLGLVDASGRGAGARWWLKMSE